MRERDNLEKPVSVNGIALSDLIGNLSFFFPFPPFPLFPFPFPSIRDRVSLCSPSWPQTWDSLISASPVPDYRCVPPHPVMKRYNTFLSLITRIMTDTYTAKDRLARENNNEFIKQNFMWDKNLPKWRPINPRKTVFLSLGLIKNGQLCRNVTEQKIWSNGKNLTGKSSKACLFSLLSDSD